MNAPDPLEVERLLPEDARRVTVDDHAAFRASLAPKPPADPIDELVGELREIEADREAASQ